MGNPSETTGPIHIKHPSPDFFMKTNPPAHYFFSENVPPVDEWHNNTDNKEVTIHRTTSIIDDLHSEFGVSKNPGKTLFPEVSNSPEGWKWS